MAFASAIQRRKPFASHGYPHSCVVDRTPSSTFGLMLCCEITLVPVPQITKVEFVGKCSSMLGSMDRICVRHNGGDYEVDPSSVCPLVTFHNSRASGDSSLRILPNGDSQFKERGNDISNGTLVAILEVNGFWTEIAFMKEDQKCIGWVRSAYIRA